MAEYSWCDSFSRPQPHSTRLCTWRLSLQTMAQRIINGVLRKVLHRISAAEWRLVSGSMSHHDFKMRRLIKAGLMDQMRQLPTRQAACVAVFLVFATAAAQLQDEIMQRNTAMTVRAKRFSEISRRKALLAEVIRRILRHGQQLHENLSIIVAFGYCEFHTAEHGNCCLPVSELKAELRHIPSNRFV